MYSLKKKHKFNLFMPKTVGYETDDRRRGFAIFEGHSNIPVPIFGRNRSDALKSFLKKYPGWKFAKQHIRIMG